MNITQTTDATTQRHLRLWPAVVIVTLQWLLRFILPAIFPGAEVFGYPLEIVGVLAGLALGVVIVLWWLFFSRAPWSERLLAVAAMIGAFFVTRPLMHASIQNGMMERMLLFFLVPPTLALALVAWAGTSRRLSVGSRYATLVVAMLLGCGVWAFARTNGIHGGLADMEWRWTPTAEEILLAQVRDEPPAAPSPSPERGTTPDLSKAPAASATPLESPAPTTAEPAAPAVPSERKNARGEGPAKGEAKTTPVEPPVTSEHATARVEWPGFRGPNRDSVIRGVLIKTDWSASPPVQMWRRPIGPGWSSFAVDGDLLYTQEQRGNDEIVACYRVSTGEPVWRHRDPVRFWESNGGAGPRGTPTLSNGRLYSLGATGIVNALDAATGAVIWSRNAATDAAVELPGWGFTSSPLVTDNAVIVAVGGQLVAYETRSGDPRWFGPKGGSGYSSPHLVTIAGVPQVLLLRGSRTISVSPADGTLLWEHVWIPGVGIVQPAMTADGDVLITTGDAMGGLGIRRVSVAKGNQGWNVEERWTTRGLKPYFNDLVVHKGYAFGFDGSILACIDLQDGSRKWKGGRYGNGQVVLLAEQDLLLVLSEDGELALVGATPDKYTEIAKIPALDGKTWNHPVVVGDILLARNGQEMAAFRLPPGDR